MQRKFNRNQLRRLVGNRNLKKEWAKFQADKYGANYRKICKPKAELMGGRSIGLFERLSRGVERETKC